jgi:alkylated DNA repair protein alkB family protein 1
VTPYLPDVRRALRIEGVDGLHFLPNPFTDAQQRYWTRRAITDYTVGNTTNLSNLANLEGVSDEEGGAVWDAWRADLMPQVRWASLGYRYFWTEREYRAAKRPFPDDLKRLSAHLSGAVGPSGPIDAQAAIVNFYGRSHTMGGHVDNAEKDMTKPIVSCSFGAAAIFLIGGRTRDTAPVAIRVRSGDVVLMGGESRVCVHGVPRILDADIPEALVTAGREEEMEGGVAGDTKEGDEGAEGECGGAYYPEACAAFMRTVRRVNINVRQMFPSSSGGGAIVDTQDGGGGGIDDGIGGGGGGELGKS